MKYLLLFFLFACKEENSHYDSESELFCTEFSEEFDMMKTQILVFEGEVYDSNKNLETFTEKCNHDKIAIELSIQKENYGYYDCDTIVDFSQGIYKDIAEVIMTDSELQIDIRNDSEMLVCMSIYTYWEQDFNEDNLIWFNE